MYGDYYYDSVWAAAAGIVIVLLLLILALAVLFYVFTGIGLYTIGKRRGVQAPWLAWLIPSFVVGAIADDYDERTKGKAMGLRWILLGLTIGSIVLNNIGISSLSLYAYSGYGSAYGAGSGVAILTGAIIGITLLVFTYIALFRLYKSANPNSAVTMLVLSIFFPVIVPFVIFGVRKRDDGMPMNYGQQGPMGYANPYGGQPPYYGQNQYQPYQGYQNPAGGFAPQGYQQPMQQNPSAPYPGNMQYQGNPAQAPGQQPAQPQQNGAEPGEDPSQN